MMGEIGNASPADGSPTQTRQPLLPRTLSPTQMSVKQIRRKSPFVLRSDSDEDNPSSHDSIFEAVYHSGGSSDENWNSIALTTLSGNQQSVGAQLNDENAREGVAHPTLKAPQDVEFRYGRGTVLDPIKEQSSYATINSLARSKSVDDMPQSSFLTRRDSFKVAKTPRRQHSFSLDDLALMKQSYHDVCASIEGAPGVSHKSSFSIHEIYAEPKLPINAPLQRPPTPPGMPSWTQGQNVSARPRPSRPQQNLFQRWFGIAATGSIAAPQLSNPNNNGTRSASNPGDRRVPRFRPPRSTYTSLQRHPFNNAPFAAVQPQSTAADVSGSASASQPRRHQSLGQRVRFTSSARSRDSEVNALRGLMQSTGSSALHPIPPMEAVANPPPTPVVIECPHRKGRRAVIKRLRGSQDHQTHPASPPPSNLPNPPDARTPTSSPTRQTPDLLSQQASAEAGTDFINWFSSRPISASSTAHLLTGESPSPHATAKKTARRSFFAQSPEPSTKDVWCWHCQVDRFSKKIDECWLQTANYCCFVCCGFETDGDGFVGPNQDLVGPRMVMLSTPVVAL